MKYLATIRKQQGLTQNELAEMVGISMNSLARYERGEVQPPVKIGIAIAKALHVDLIELFEGIKNKKTKITLSYDWDKYEKGELDMLGREFDVFLGKNGAIGLKGSRVLRTREAVEEFLSEIRLQVESAFEAQVKRGTVKLIEQRKSETE